MGFRKGAYATVWEVNNQSEVITKGRISISRKNKSTGEYEEDFSGFVRFAGTATAQSALTLKERDRIKLGDVDVSSWYNKEKNVTYYSFVIFNFEKVESKHSTDSDTSMGSSPQVDSGEVESPDLPF